MCVMCACACVVCVCVCAGGAPACLPARGKAEQRTAVAKAKMLLLCTRLCLLCGAEARAAPSRLST